MKTLMAIVAGLFLVAGLATLLHAIRHAPEGGEDVLGFHRSRRSAPAATARSAADVPAPHAVPHDCLAP